MLIFYIVKQRKKQQFSPSKQPVRSAYQPPASSTFLSERISHQQPAATSQLLAGCGWLVRSERKILLAGG
jgi:hypothetical protein